MGVRWACGAAAGVLLVWSASPAGASPSLPSVDALSPGIGVAVFDAASSGGDTCTAGFPVRDRSGRVGLLTAGHCNQGGPVAIKLSGTDYTRIGTFDGTLGRGDIGYVTLPSWVPVNATIPGVGPVKGATDQVVNGEVLCKAGLSTGVQCGPVTDVTADTVTFAATTHCGDSGGPVYAVRPDGSVTAVGITTAETMGDGTAAPHCGGDFTSAVAQLIQPWLRGQSMSVLTG